MQRDLEALTDHRFDLVVIGGGIFGAFAALDAAQRGLSVALIERDDFGGATSANSYKLVHGGIRYLQHGDLFRIRQSSNERRALLRIAPHLVQPLPIVVPTYGRGMRGKAALRVGMALYDALTLDRNRGISDQSRKVPWGRSLSRSEVLERFPGLDPANLTGGAVFCDGQMYNPPRLVLAVVQSAVRAGAVAANYVEATGFQRQGERVAAVTARDVLTGDELEIRAAAVLNAAGPYAERLLGRTGLPLVPSGEYSRDACFVVPRPLLDQQYALAVQGQTRDPDAVLSRGERHLFIAPWREYTLVGVWHVVYTGDPDRFTVTDEELERFIAEVKAGYPSLDLSVDDVSIWNAGLVPFGRNPRDATDLRYGHRSRLVDHARTDGLNNLITLIGVRFTTGRYESERAVDLVFRKLGQDPPRGRTATTPLVGGDITNLDELLNEASRTHAASLGADVVQSLVRNYGSEYGRVTSHLHDDTGWGTAIGGSTTIRAQVVHAVREEMARTVGDIVFRRTDLATGDYPGLQALESCAAILAAELGLSAREVEAQIARVAARFPQRVVERARRGTPRGAVTY